MSKSKRKNILKKSLIILCALMLIVSFSACKTETVTSDSTIDTPEKFEEVFKFYVDYANYEKTEHSGTDYVVAYFAQDPPLGTKDFEELSFECGGDLECGLLNRWIEGRGWIQHDNGLYYNEEGQSIKITVEDREIAAFYIIIAEKKVDTGTGKAYIQINDKAPTFWLSESISNDSTFEQMLETYGAPLYVIYAANAEQNLGNLEMVFQYGHTRVMLVHMDPITNQLLDIQIAPFGWLASFKQQ